MGERESKFEIMYSASSGCSLGITRNDDPETPLVLEGYAARFNVLSDDLSPFPDYLSFREKIDPGAFKDVLSDDVRYLFNHDASLILGRTVSKTLEISEDDLGLMTRVNPADTQLSRDLSVLIERGDITQMSFAFIIAEDGDTIEIKETPEKDFVTRTIHKFQEIRDVSAVTYPAYPQTSVKVRESIQEIIEPILEKRELSKGTPRLNSTTVRLNAAIREGRLI